MRLLAGGFCYVTFCYGRLLLHNSLLRRLLLPNFLIEGASATNFFCQGRLLAGGLCCRSFCYMRHLLPNFLIGRLPAGGFCLTIFCYGWLLLHNFLLDRLLLHIFLKGGCLQDAFAINFLSGGNLPYITFC